MKARIVTIFILLSALKPVNSQDTDSLKYVVLAPAEFLNKFLSTPNSVLIDVRDSKDFNKSRIKGAVNIPYPVKNEYFADSAAISPEKSLFVYCYAGVRSKKTAVIFYNNGFRNNYSLEGGFTSWKLKKMPVERKRLRVKGN